jgi:tRNA1Val (adenine37-N6)-methyltransferase
MTRTQKKPHSDETLDTIYHGKLKLFQKKKGYRFSIDAVLLAEFVRKLKGERLIDIGTGCGVVPLMIALNNPAIKITGIEIQESLYDLATRNVIENGFTKRVKIINYDIRDAKSIFKGGSFDIVTANPPYIKSDSGRLNPHEEKAIARHELTISLEGLIKTAKYLLTSTGKLVIIYPAKRAVDLLDLLRRENIEPKMIQMVHSKVDTEAKLIIVKASKSAKKGGLKILKPCIIYNEDKTYTKDVERILNGN